MRAERDERRLRRAGVPREEPSDPAALPSEGIFSEPAEGVFPSGGLSAPAARMSAVGASGAGVPLAPSAVEAVAVPSGGGVGPLASWEPWAGRVLRPSRGPTLPM